MFFYYVSLFGLSAAILGYYLVLLSGKKWSLLSKVLIGLVLGIFFQAFILFVAGGGRWPSVEVVEFGSLLMLAAGLLGLGAMSSKIVDDFTLLRQVSDAIPLSHEIKLIKSTFQHEAETKAALNAFIHSAPILSFSEQCQLFERNFARYQGRKHCVFVNSGSSANLAMIQALLNLGRLKKGDQVGFSALTWSTNAMPLIQLGLQAVPIDVEIDTLNVSSRTLNKVLEKTKLKALFITNLLGFCDDIEVTADICKKRHIIMLEDNCESMGTVYKGKKLGNYSLASSFSFYVGHHMSTIEGGAVTTDDEELATMLRMVRAHGWDRNLALSDQEKIRHKHNVNSTFYSRYTFYDLGFNLRPTEIAGFLGNNQLQYIDEIVNRRNKIFLTLAKQLYRQTEKYYPIRYSHIDFVSNFAVPVVCRSQALRDELVEACSGKIEIRPIVGGDMTQQPFFDKYVDGYQQFMKNSQSKLIHQQGLYFGNNPELTDSELDVILDIFTR